MESFPDAAVSEGKDDLTLIREEKGVQRCFINAGSMNDTRWESPILTEDWNVFCPTLYDYGEFQDLSRNLVQYMDMCRVLKTGKKITSSKKVRTLNTICDRRLEEKHCCVADTFTEFIGGTATGEMIVHG